MSSGFVCPNCGRTYNLTDRDSSYCIRCDSLLKPCSTYEKFPGLAGMPDRMNNIEAWIRELEANIKTIMRRLNINE